VSDTQFQHPVSYKNKDSLLIGTIGMLFLFLNSSSKVVWVLTNNTYKVQHK